MSYKIEPEILKNLQRFNFTQIAFCSTWGIARFIVCDKNSGIPKLYSMRKDHRTPSYESVIVPTFNYRTCGGFVPNVKAAISAGKKIYQCTEKELEKYLVIRDTGDIGLCTRYVNNTILRYYKDIERDDSIRNKVKMYYLLQ